ALDPGEISVGPPYFGLMFTIMMAPLVLLLPLGPLVKWQREQPSKQLAMLLPWLVLALVCGVAANFMAPRGPLKTAACVAGAAWVGAGPLRFVCARLRVSVRLTSEMAGMALAHTGIAVFLAGALLVQA